MATHDHTGDGLQPWGAYRVCAEWLAIAGLTWERVRLALLLLVRGCESLTVERVRCRAGVRQATAATLVAATPSRAMQRLAASRSRLRAAAAWGGFPSQGARLRGLALPAVLRRTPLGRLDII